MPLCVLGCEGLLPWQGCAPLYGQRTPGNPQPSAHLLAGGERLNQFLHSARAVGVERHVDQLTVLSGAAQHLQGRAGQGTGGREERREEGGKARWRGGGRRRAVACAAPVAAPPAGPLLLSISYPLQLRIPPSAASHTPPNATHSRTHLQALLLAAPVQQFLDEIVAKGVLHQVNQLVQNLLQAGRERRERAGKAAQRGDTSVVGCGQTIRGRGLPKPLLLYPHQLGAASALHSRPQPQLVVWK